MKTLHCCALFAFAALAGPQVLRAETLAIAHVTLIDGTGNPARSDMTVLVDGARIAAVEPAAKARIPNDARTVDARGKFLIPGLWDMHVHLAKAGADALPLFVANGVTSVRDMGGDFAETLKWKSEIENGKRLGPRIKTAGPILESAKHVEGMKRGGTVEPVERTRIGIANAEQADAAVAFVAKLGVDFVKVRTVESLDVYRAIADAARRAGLPLVGHPVASPEEMIRAGQRSVEHSLLPGIGNRTEQKRGELFKQYVAGGIAMVPTAVVGEKSLAVPQDDASRLVDDREGKIDPRRKYLSGYLIEDWREQVAERKSGLPLDYKKLTESLRPLWQEMHRAGVCILPGTDVGVVLIYPGFSLHDELELLVRGIGMTTMEALVSATRRPAEFFGIQDTLGTVEAGKIADLVLLDADPLLDIRNTRQIRAVVQSGKFLDRPALDDILAQVAATARQGNGKK
jgi:imidazolonepropionase-like amidohydrolase